MNDSVRSDPTSSRLGRILREAEELFLQEGFLHFSMDELARRLRCSKRTIYKLASSRDRFIESIISRHLMRLNENLFEAAEVPQLDVCDWRDPGCHRSHIRAARHTICYRSYTI